MTTNPHEDGMEYTGERMVPERSDVVTFWEHVYRYAFAVRQAPGRRVLDIASGDGYGTAALRAAGAASVVGVDVSEAACAHARRRYGVDARVGDGAAIPLPDGSVDLVVSFETVEHVPDPLRFLDECNRVLAPGGRLIISTPEKQVYDDRLDNPFHCSEMTEAEFTAAVSARFDGVTLFGQRPMKVGWRSPHWLAANTPPWRAARGLRRLRHRIQRRLVPDATHPPTDAQRRDVVQLVLDRGATPDHRLNPFTLRPRRPGVSEQVTYLVAVADRRA